MPVATPTANSRVFDRKLPRVRVEPPCLGAAASGAAPSGALSRELSRERVRRLKRLLRFPPQMAPSGESRLRGVACASSAAAACRSFTRVPLGASGVARSACALSMRANACTWSPMGRVTLSRARGLSSSPTSSTSSCNATEGDGSESPARLSCCRG